jgi:hypothetical protein
VPTGVKQEAFTLLLLVVAVDAVFIAVYFITGLRDASSPAKLIFTVVWTILTLAVVIRGISRIRTVRVGRKSR